MQPAPNSRHHPTPDEMNGTAYILDDRAGALANYPHARQYGGLIFISGISSRRRDNTHEGVRIGGDGSVTLDIREQTRAVIENIREILHAAGTDLTHLIDVTVFLVDMSDYAGMNEVYNEFFTAETGPSRTTVAVHQLPHPNLLIEIKAVAASPLPL
jgi:2-aminomuconate deaminase